MLISLSEAGTDFAQQHPSLVGRHVVRALANRHYRIRVAMRQPELCGHLQPLGRVGQIHAVQANVRYPQSVTAVVRDADVVVNLVGILFERGGGPDARTFRELMDFVLATIERRRLLVPIPFAAMKLQAACLQFLPKPPITPDQVEILKYDNVVSAAAKADGRTLEGLGITPESIGAVVPSYLWRFRKTGQFRGRTA